MKLKSSEEKVKDFCSVDFRVILTTFPDKRFFTVIHSGFFIQSFINFLDKKVNSKSYAAKFLRISKRSFG